MEPIRQARALFPSTFRNVAVFCCVLALLLDVARAAPTTRIWNGGGASDDTSLAGNWGTTGAPLAGDLLQFGGNTRLTPNQVAALSIGSLTFNSGAGAFVLGGNTYTITTSAGVTNNSTATQTINNAITLSGSSQVWNAASGSLIFGGNIAMGITGLSVMGNFNTTLSNVVSGSGTLTKTGNGVLTLTGLNTYTGQTVISGGTVSVNSLADLSVASALGAPTTTATGTIKLGTGTATPGTLIYTGGTASTNRVIDLAGSTAGATIDASGTGALTFTSAMTASGAGSKTLTLTGSNTDANTFAGAIVNNASNRTTSVLKTGSGTWTLSGANTYTGSTTVSGGVLNLQSSAALGSGTGSTTVGSSAALQIQGVNLTIAEALTLNGSGISNDGALRNISGNNTWSGAIALSSATTIGSDSGNLTLSGVVSGANDLTKVGAGTLTLSNSNTFSGAVAIQNGTVSTAGSGLGVATSAITLGASGTTGTLQYTGATASSSRAFNLATGGAGVIDVSLAGTTLTLSAGATISGNGAFEKSGLGTLLLTTANTFTGSTTINAGTLTAGNGTALGPAASASVLFGASSTGRLQLNGNNTTIVGLNSNAVLGAPVIESGSATAGTDTLTVNTANSDSYGGVLQNGSTRLLALTKSGSGTLTLSGTNTYTGGTTINGGTVVVNSGSSLGTGNLALNAGTLEVATGFATTRNVVLGSASSMLQIDPAQTYTNSGVISGNGALNKTGSGTLVLSGVNTYLGGTTLNGGTLVANSAASLGTSSGGLTVNAGTLEVATGYTTTRAITLGDSGSTLQIDPNQTLTVGTAIAGSGTLNKTGAGTLVLNGSNTYSGGTNVNAGTLQIGGNDRLLTTGALTLSGGTLDLQNFNQTVGSFTLLSGTVTGTGTLTVPSFALQSGTQNTSFGGSGTLTKSGTGTVLMTAANSYTGATSVTGGILEVDVNNALGTVATGTTVSSGAALRLNNVTYSTAEALTLNGTGISNGGALVNIGTSTYAGAVTAATNATINAGGNLTFTGGLVKNGTTLTFTGGGTINVKNVGISGSAANSDVVIDNETVVLSAKSTYNGPTTVQSSGILQLGASNVLPSSPDPQTALTLNTSGTFDLAKYNDGVASLAGDSSGIVKNSVAGTTSTLTVNPTTGVSTTFNGVITGISSGGDVNVLKSGAGALTLTGANTFSGSTTVSGGTLTLAAMSGGALGSTSSITVNSGGTLLLGASNQINNAATVTLAGGTISKGDFSEGTAGSSGVPGTAGVGALTLTATGSHLDFGTGTVGTLNFASFTPGSFTLTIDNWTGTINTAGNSAADRLIFDTNQSSNLSSFSFTGFGTGASQFDLGNGYYEITPVTAAPEPSTYAAAALAALALGAHFRAVRRRQRAAVVKVDPAAR